jgi:hypothetical protein
MLAVAHRLLRRRRRTALALGMCMTAAIAAGFLRARINSDAALVAKQREMVDSLQQLERGCDHCRVSSCGASIYVRDLERLEVVQRELTGQSLGGDCSLHHGRYDCR